MLQKLSVVSDEGFSLLRTESFECNRCAAACEFNIMDSRAAAFLALGEFYAGMKKPCSRPAGGKKPAPIRIHSAATWSDQLIPGICEQGTDSRGSLLRKMR